LGGGGVVSVAFMPNSILVFYEMKYKVFYEMKYKVFYEMKYKVFYEMKYKVFYCVYDIHTVNARAHISPQPVSAGLITT
jgi:hypothetical protein